MNELLFVHKNYCRTIKGIFHTKLNLFHRNQMNGLGMLTRQSNKRAFYIDYNYYTMILWKRLTTGCFINSSTHEKLNQINHTNKSFWLVSF